jgi:hypothetical protein
MDDTAILERLDRIAEGIEKLAEDPVVNVETGPPVCPHCETMNPIVRVKDAEANGKLGAFVIECVCLHCENRLWALPLMWRTAPSIEAANEINNERAEMYGER